jgi:hypothetical protein
VGLSVGDTIFSGKGQPGVITKKDVESGELTIEREGENLEKTRRMGFINGIPAARRAEFNKIITEVRAEKESQKQIQMLTKKIEELKVDPRNFVLTKYLESEMAHIMNTEGIHPKEYKISEDSARL